MNEIVDFVSQGKNLLSDEGEKLLEESDRSVLKEAADSDPLIAKQLLAAMNKSPDPHFRRKILLALSD